MLMDERYLIALSGTECDNGVRETLIIIMHFEMQEKLEGKASRKLHCAQLGTWKNELSVRKCENIFSLRNVDPIAE